MTLALFFFLANLIALNGLAQEEMAAWENTSTSVVEALALVAHRTLVTLQVYASGVWVVVTALQTLARWWAPVTIGV